MSENKITDLMQERISLIYQIKNLRQNKCDQNTIQEVEEEQIQNHEKRLNDIGHELKEEVYHLRQLTDIIESKNRDTGVSNTKNSIVRGQSDSSEKSKNLKLKPSLSKTFEKNSVALDTSQDIIEMQDSTVFLNIPKTNEHISSDTFINVLSTPTHFTKSNSELCTKLESQHKSQNYENNQNNGLTDNSERQFFDLEKDSWEYINTNNSKDENYIGNQEHHNFDSEFSNINGEDYNYYRRLSQERQQNQNNFRSEFSNYKDNPNRHQGKSFFRYANSYREFYDNLDTKRVQFPILNLRELPNYTVKQEDNVLTNNNRIDSSDDFNDNIQPILNQNTCFQNGHNFRTHQANPNQPKQYNSISSNSNEFCEVLKRDENFELDFIDSLISAVRSIVNSTMNNQRNSNLRSDQYQNFNKKGSNMSQIWDGNMEDFSYSNNKIFNQNRRGKRNRRTQRSRSFANLLKRGF
ncbi:probable serine/threonine-protein kinase clkA [Sitodiplosis mosellana]|uniref:probable serine/threonine-protein kinase clkA n=1 Tax=Sitodiplosis mosellana TaxID=263140 RepID=UPI0024438577|nr:probable serine/threonine-protein kinase clkA [Sitodiplosis mosellana]